MSELRERCMGSEEVDGAFADVVAEIADRLGAGEAVDVEAYLAGHPEWAERLRRLLPAMEAMAHVSGSGKEKAEERTRGEGESLGGTLGDFRLVREIGRGGMGVVYEAEQISLRRRVALKVLPLAATMDPRHLQRFHNEAQAAACLHHTNIVPVHAVGCERGVHYYAMQFIDGLPLSEVIRQRRQAEEKRAGDAAAPVDGKPEEVRTIAYQVGPAGPVTASPTVRAGGDSTPLTGQGRRNQDYYRKVAELGVQAAEALDHAHQVGIVHRDVKPGNLLIDGAGRVWVTDFGLAQVRQGETGLTLTGEMVGTVRYMSPEQALAQRVVIDHRTDVYSLGATLYELLTLRPVFEGNDRQELLRQIAFEEPRAPRKVARAIPAELETIVLKAMEKNPAHRYAKAQDMAEDLERFLRNEPIRARRPTMVQRVRKWGRRHRSVLSAAGVCLLLVLMVAAASIGWVVRDREERRIRLGRHVALILDDVDRLEREQKWPQAQAAAERAEAALEGGEADDAVRRRVGEVRHDLALVARLDRIRQKRATFVEGKFNHAGAERDYAVAFREYGVDVEALPSEKAIAQLREKPTLAVPIAAALDDWVEVRRNLGEGEPRWKPLIALARGLDPDPLRDRLRATWGRAVTPELQAELLRLVESIDVKTQHPAALFALAVSVKGAGLDGVAVRIWRDGQYTYPTDFWLNCALALALQERKDYAEAIRYCSVAVSLRPDSALARSNLGVALKEQGKVAEAIACYRKAIEIDPKLALAHSNLGIALKDKGKVEEAIACCRKAIALDPKDAQAHNNLGIALKDKGKVEEAIACYHKAIALDSKYANAHNNLGNALSGKGQTDEAIACYRKAIALDPKMAAVRCNLGEALRRKGKVEEAIAYCRQAIELDPKYAAAHNNLGLALKEHGKVAEAIACFRKAIEIDLKFAQAHNNLGAALHAKGQVGEAIACFRKAITLDPKQALAHYNLGNALYGKGQVDEAIACFRKAIALDPKDAKAHTNLGVALVGKGQVDEAIACLRKAIALDPKDAKAHYNLGNVLRDKGQVDEAIACHRRAIALDPNLPNAHGALGEALMQQGKFVEAQQSLRRSLTLLPPSDPLRAHILALSQQCRQRTAADSHLKAFLSGKGAPSDAAAQVQMASVAQLPFRQLNLTAARLYRDAFARKPPLADAHRYNAACSAAQAGCSKSKDADRLEEKELAQLRQQALNWLRADLVAWKSRLKTDSQKDFPVIVQQMRHWLQDGDFAGVRGPDALAKLPESERAGWQKLWTDVADLLTTAERKSTLAGKPDAK
jgi:tetratricopeptide (TPR) repeat protein